MKVGNVRRFLILIVLILATTASSAFAEKWSFAVFSDNRHFEAAYRGVLENMKGGGPSDPQFPKPDFVVGVGDIDPVSRTFQIFKDTMGPEKTFIPVRGNHEARDDVRFILKDILPLERPPVTVYEKESATFYYDWKNVRLIVVDQYTDYAKNLGDPKFLGWVEKAIKSAKHADHVFISFHEPRFPADAHSDPFWSMLLRHTDKVRAVLWAHSHVYARRSLTNSHGEIELINAGAAGNPGHSDGMDTYVEIAIDGKLVSFRAVQAPDKTNDFRVTDNWKAKAN